ncbi:MAG: T3SS (YopN, CesT) and YbjN peptide-binding chaperone 1 [Actinomycetes bacterium]
MSYEDMARSHVKELAREAFELAEVVVDDDGDLPFPCGTAMFYVSVVRDGRLVRGWSRAVSGIAVTKPVLKELNEVNTSLMLARAYATTSCVWVEGCLPVDTLTPRDLGCLCVEVGTTADRLGSMLAAVHGGQVAFPGGCDAAHECEE